MCHRCDMRCLHCRRRVADYYRQKQKAMTNSPCKGCERRTARPNCHSTCAEYKQFVLDRTAYNESRRKSSIIAEYIKQSHTKKEKTK